MTKKVCLWVLTLLWAAIIFGFSAQPAEDSGGLSLSITTCIVESLSGIGDWDLTEQADMTKLLHHAIRKLAHFGIYAVLGVLLSALLASYGVMNRQAFCRAFPIGFLYAVSDEIHQYFVPGRSCEITDVCIDSAGVAAGCLFLFAVLRYLYHRKVKKVD